VPLKPTTTELLKAPKETNSSECHYSATAMTDKQAANAGMLPPPSVAAKMESIGESLADIDFTAAAAQLPGSSRGTVPRSSSVTKVHFEETPASKGKGRGVSSPSSGSNSPSSTRPTSQVRRGRGSSNYRGRFKRPALPPQKLASVFQSIDEEDLPDPSVADPVTSEQIDQMSEVSSKLQDIVQDHDELLNELVDRLEKMEQSYGILLSKHTNLQKECDGLRALVSTNKRGPQGGVVLGGQQVPHSTPPWSSLPPPVPISKRAGTEEAPKPTAQGGMDPLVASSSGRRRAKY